MTNIDGWEQQPGGLYLAVPRFDQTSADHRDAAANVMRSVVQTVAQVHGASFSEQSFRSNMAAVYAGDIKVDLYLAKWEVCQPQVVCVGAALSWDTVGIDADGRSNRAFYTEDVCILKPELRNLVRQKPAGAVFPEEGLAQCFERISLQNMLRRDGAAFRFGEVDLDNTTMMRQLGGNGALIGSHADSAVLEFKTLPNNLMASWPMDVKVIALRKDGVLDDNNFIVRWKDGAHDLRFIVTKGRATAAGQPRADIRPWHNGHLPEPAILDRVLASTLLAIKNEIQDNRKWGEQSARYQPSPSIPLLAPRSDIYAALYNACGSEIGINTTDRPSLFSPMPDAHVYVLNDQPMLEAFTAAGAETRKFGHKPMIPGVNVLKPGLGLRV